MALKTTYRCPLCKLQGSDTTKVHRINNLTYKKKVDKTRYMTFKVGICDGCGVLYTYETISPED